MPGVYNKHGRGKIIILKINKNIDIKKLHIHRMCKIKNENNSFCNIIFRINYYYKILCDDKCSVTLVSDIIRLLRTRR